jgi:triosephosphate isomerase
MEMVCMVSGARFWVGTSWKMNNTRDKARQFARGLAGSGVARDAALQLFVVPAFPYIADVAEVLAGEPILVGAQNMHWEDDGAWTGEVSAPMLKDCGATLVEIGHSERRRHFHETDETVARKVGTAVRHGLLPLVCVGETRQERDQGRADAVVERQVEAALSPLPRAAVGSLMFAYEPVWSIGEKGEPAAPGLVAKAHRRIKEICKITKGCEMPVLYGGSVNAGNCAAYAREPAVDGLFVGRAAWELAGFLAIIKTVALEIGRRT